jgi:hypothetical protein
MWSEKIFKLWDEYPHDPDSENMIAPLENDRLLLWINYPASRNSMQKKKTTENVKFVADKICDRLCRSGNH